MYLIPLSLRYITIPHDFCDKYVLELSEFSADIYSNFKVRRFLTNGDIKWAQLANGVASVWANLDIPSTVLSLTLPQIRFHHIITVDFTINITSFIIYRYSVTYSLKNKCLSH